jgi:DNA polymerase III subunit epsilon
VIFKDDDKLDVMAKALVESGDYRVLRRLVPRDSAPSDGPGAKIGIVLDAETTGLDRCNDEVIELAMVKFDYLPDGCILGLRTSSVPSMSLPSRSLPT